ncbi:MAG: DUF1800 domain-containing protein [Asticcacaulis sp.]|nr:DUF1800 domain-containing protein [Asticcacaulis sp.]
MSMPQGLETALALSRFGLGSNTDGIAAVTGDIRDRLKAEIAAGAPVPDHPDLQSTPDLLVTVYQYEMDKKAERDAMKSAPPPAQTDTMAPRAMKPGADLDNPIRPAVIAELDARFNGTMMTPQIGFNERMVMFWTNHFAISQKKNQQVAAISGAYEREAIRPNVFGKFYDLVLAVETHPAMLIYLDNFQSVGPGSAGARDGGRGLNENLAREILELHTMGVGSGYSQADVTSFAKVITGWTITRKANRRTPGTFVFNDRTHEPGPQTVLGKTYAQGDMEQGKAVLRDLSRHPATARHIATKLARHFVADAPPPALVKRLSDTFLATDGDLAEVSRALIDAPESWSPKLTKMRSPLEYVAATLRATGATLKPQAIVTALNAMGQPWWQPPGPNGFPDTVAAWASPESLATRMEFVNSLASGADRSVDPRAFAESRLGALLDDHTREAVARAESQAQGLGLVFLSPEFMRR